MTMRFEANFSLRSTAAMIDKMTGSGLGDEKVLWVFVAGLYASVA